MQLCSLYTVPPTIKDTEQVTNMSVMVNQLASLFCEVEGTPTPIITWYKDDVQVGRMVRDAEFLPLPGRVGSSRTLLCFNFLWIWPQRVPLQVTESKDTIQIVNGGKTLKLFQASAEDAGSYSCKAINIAGTSQKHFHIDVLGNKHTVSAEL